MINLTALSQVTTQATALSNLLLVNPQNDVGIQPQLINGDTQDTPPKFLFNYYGEQTVTLESDITDHYIEDNTALQDQISLKPILITGQGYIGELTDITPEALEPLRTAAEKLQTLVAYTPQLTVTAQLAYNTAFQTYQVLQLAANTAVSAWTAVASNTPGLVNSLSKFANQNKQQQAFLLFQGYWASRTLFTIQTPWAVFKNCAIQTLRAVQDQDTRVITDFEVTFKEIKIAQTRELFVANNAQGQLKNQIEAGQPPIDGGTYAPPAGDSLTTALGNNSYFGL